MTTETIERFMDDEYSINTSQRSIRILVGAGFLEFQDIEKQYQNCNKVQRRIGRQGLDDLVAKVFSLAYPYDFLLTKENNNLVRWSGWLGIAEYRLGVVVEKMEIKKKLFEKSLEHLLESKKRGDNSKENTGHIGNCYFKSNRYEQALPFLLESREKGDDSKENAGYIGKCYFKLKRYEEALDFFLESRKKGNSSKENASCIGECYFRLKRYEEALPFLLESRKKGDDSKENTGFIGNCYFKLKRYEEALTFLLESREKGDDSKENASFMGGCYFRLRGYGQGISEYEKALEIATQEDFDHGWVHTFDHILEDSFDLLTKLQSSIQTPVYRDLLQRFEALYDNFVHYWEKNKQEREIYFKLRYHNHQPFDRIGNALGEVS